MADSVYFATVQAPTPSGFNVFASPFLDSAIFPVPSDQFPTQVPLDGIVEIFWRVKNWNLSTDIARGGIPVTSGIATPDAANASTELDLELPATLHSWSWGGTETTFTPADSIVADGASLYPDMFISSGIGWGSVPSQFPSPPWTPAGSFVGSLMGFDLPIYLFQIGATAITGTFLTITPAEYWPYANSEGLPVWDTSTGAQLRDPRS